MKYITPYGWFLLAFSVSSLALVPVTVNALSLKREYDLAGDSSPLVQYPSSEGAKFTQTYGQKTPDKPHRINQPAMSKSSRSVKRTLSQYSDYYEGRTMSNGKKFRQAGMTVASNDWPLGTLLTITRGSKIVSVVVTDRMARRFTNIRIDGSRAACKALGMTKPGLMEVEVYKR